MAAPVITPQTLPQGVVNALYPATFTATGGVLPYVTWVVFSGALPPGVLLNASTGTLYGIPTEIGTYNFTLKVTDSAPLTSASQAFTIVTIGPTYPITLSSIADWVCADVLKRQDILTSVQAGILNFYKTLCRRVPFDELLIKSNECPMIQGQALYNLNTILDVNGNPLNPVLKSIYSIRISFGPQGTSGSQQFPSLRLRRSSSRLYDALSATLPGQTSTYSRFGKNIEVNPAPNASNWTLRFRYWAIAPLDATPINSIIIMDDDWAELIRWEGLYRAYTYLGMTSEAMALVAPAPQSQPGSPRRRLMTETGIIPRLWNDLCATLSARENADEDFSINPVVRDYSIR